MYSAGTTLRQQMLPKLAEYDYIYTFGTTATTMTKSLVANRKPLIFNVVSDPVGQTSSRKTKPRTAW